MRLPEPRFIAFGEAAVLVEVAGPVDAQWLDATLRRAAPAWLRGAVPGLASVLVEFDPFTIQLDAVADALASHLASREAAALSRGRDRLIPVVYGGEHGPDLDEVAGLLGRSPTDVVAQHAAARLSVLFLGFAPGFAYLGDLPGELHVPRMPTPRVRTPIGSVGIAGAMSGVYPAELPGGWRVIGRTPVALFDPDRERPAYLAPGDTVRFERIEERDWDRFAGAPSDW